MFFFFWGILQAADALHPAAPKAPAGAAQGHEWPPKDHRWSLKETSIYFGKRVMIEKNIDVRAKRATSKNHRLQVSKRF